MKKSLVFLASLIFILLSNISPSYAEIVCTPNTQEQVSEISADYIYPSDPNDPFRGEALVRTAATVHVLSVFIGRDEEILSIISDSANQTPRLRVDIQIYESVAGDQDARPGQAQFDDGTISLTTNVTCRLR